LIGFCPTLHTGGLAVAIPGAFKGYETIYKAFGGGVSWESLFEPTIKLCEEGIKISEHLELTLETDEAMIKRDPMLRYNDQ
jgi:gamma-glutamyltranspeptidase/glutathione hydrolase/leukotriene-C4 hydrolase